MLLCNTKCNPQDGCQDSTNPPKLDTEKDHVRWLFIHKFTQHFCLAFFLIFFFFFLFFSYFLGYPYRLPSALNLIPLSIFKFFFCFHRTYGQWVTDGSFLLLIISRVRIIFVWYCCVYLMLPVPQFSRRMFHYFRTTISTSYASAVIDVTNSYFA